MKTQPSVMSLSQPLSHAHLFAHDKNSDDQIEEPGKTHPEICRCLHQNLFREMVCGMRMGWRGQYTAIA